MVVPLLVPVLAIGFGTGFSYNNITIHSGLYNQYGYSGDGVIPPVKVTSDGYTLVIDTLSYTTIQSISENEHLLKNPPNTVKSRTKLISKRSLDNPQKQTTENLATTVKSEKKVPSKKSTTNLATTVKSEKKLLFEQPTKNFTTSVTLEKKLLSKNSRKKLATAVKSKKKLLTKQSAKNLTKAVKAEKKLLSDKSTKNIATTVSTETDLVMNENNLLRMSRKNKTRLSIQNPRIPEKNEARVAVQYPGIPVTIFQPETKTEWKWKLPTEAPVLRYNEEGELGYAERSIANTLKHQVRVLCMVMTHPSNHRVRAIHVKATWGQRCNKLIFMSTEDDPTLPAVKLPVREGSQTLYGKTKAAFKYVYERHRRDADWFLKAEDDTYVVVENLRYLLAAHDSRDSIYFGCRLRSKLDPKRQGYMNSGAGYVLSRAALDGFVKKALPSPRLCKPGDEGDVDIEISNCLEAIGVRAEDSRDPLNRARFFPLKPMDHLFANKDTNDWYWSHQYYPNEKGSDCCSDHAISFHGIVPEDMYVMDYLLYKLKPYGISFSPPATPAYKIREYH